MLSDTLISPRADQSIRNRCADYKKRTSSPNFKDILRQRCRERVKSRRQNLFDNLRSLQSEEHMRNTLSQYIENDLKDLQSSCVLNKIDVPESMEVLENDPLSSLAVSDEEKWILEEYDRLIENTNAQVELASAVTCPLCVRGLLRSDLQANTISCSQCTLHLPLKVSLEELERTICAAVDVHSQHCPGDPQFTICPDSFTNNLFLLCSLCCQLQQIV